MSGIVILLLVVTVVCLVRVYKRRKYPPGPIHWPLVGNSLSILWREEPILYFHELGQRYGGIFTFYFGWKPTVVVTDTALGVEGLIDRSADFAGRPPGQALGSTTDGGKDIAFAPYDQNFVMVKKMAASALRKFTTSDHVEKTSISCFQELAEEWDTELSAFNPRDSISRLAVTFGLLVLAGKEYTMKDEEIRVIHESMNRVETMVMSGLSAELLPLLRYFMADNDEFTSLDNKLLAEFEGVLEEIDTKKKDSKSVAASLLDCANSQMNKSITKERCAHILSDFMAGSNTSVAAVLLWLVYYAASYPHAKKQLRDEVDHVLGTETMPSLADRSYMPYTQAFINETLRMRPVLPLALRHYTTTDTTLGSRPIPKNTDVMFSIYSFHRDARYWPEPNDFKPERWINENGLIPKPRHFLPFGGGVRICPGEILARNFIFLNFVSLIQRYDFNFPLGHIYADKCSSNSFISTAMVRDYNICVSKRRK